MDIDLDITTVRSSVEMQLVTARPLILLQMSGQWQRKKPSVTKKIVTTSRPQPSWEIPPDVEEALHPLPVLPSGWRWVPTGSHAICRAEHTSGVRTRMFNREQSDIRRDLLREVNELA